MTHDARIVLIVLAVIVARLVLLERYPFGPCWKCRGTGRRRGSTARRFGLCPRCGGSGRRQRAGSKAVHRAIWAFRTEASRTRRRKAAMRAAERATDPERLADKDH